MPQAPKFAFFGTPSVASETLASLLEHGFIPALVVTSPDAPKGRGLVLTPSPVKELAATRGIPILTPEKLDADAIAAIKSASCDYALVVAYGKLFPEELIASFPKGVLNVHYSLLPKYRGATPLETALLRGDAETGVTVQKMVKEMDAGDIVAQKSVTIGEAETARELRPRLIRLGAELLVEILPLYLSDSIAAVPQDPSLATRAYKIKKEDGLLELTGGGKDNWNKYRAYADSIGTYFFEDGKRMKITHASYKNGIFTVLRVIPEGRSERDYR
ncbi:MAG TPA: methionyl-tRNA formyltransferase [Candidatus Paceibacterota bacterium]|nr:methionyl-tRNA formyltransferase [Candidatus Paceibacterota bacterium]